jgi:bromodomain-containing protein 8
MSTRTRPPKRGEVDVASLSKVEKLLVAQAVFELGTDAWADVAKLLAKHSLVNRPKNSFTAQVWSCAPSFPRFSNPMSFV